MTNAYLKQIPNALTTLRLLMAIPIWLLILRENYSAVLWLAAIAGFSDLIDGWLARKLDAISRYGAVLDPLSDKALLTGTFICLAMVEAIPHGIALIVVLRDLVIIAGALSYHYLIGPYKMAPSFWGKASTLVQIVFVLMVLIQQVYPLFSSFYFEFGSLLVIGLALISGGNYVAVWSRKAWVASRESQDS